MTRAGGLLGVSVLLAAAAIIASREWFGGDGREASSVPLPAPADRSELGGREEDTESIRAAVRPAHAIDHSPEPSHVGAPRAPQVPGIASGFGSLEDHMARLEESFIHLYGDLDRRQLMRQAADMVRSFPMEIANVAHDAQFAAGGGKVVGKAEVGPSGTTFSTPHEVTKRIRYGVDRVGARDTGEIVLTSIPLDDVPDLADKLAEINWVINRAKSMHR